MNSIAINQILILLLQCFIVAVLLLSLFRLRTIFGLGLLFTALGVFQYLQVFLVSSLYIEIMPGILVSPGSMVLFTGSIFAILLIYIREDALEARKVIYAIVAANLALTLLQVIFGWAIEGEGIKNIYNLPKEFFTENAIILLAGTLILFIDAIGIVFIYEIISRYVSLLFLRILFSSVLILSLDSLLISLFAFYGTEQFSSILVSGLIAKISAAFLYSALFSVYLLYLDKSFRKNKTQASSYKDIFNSLTFRQKYELVSKEKDFQEKELQKTELKTSSILQAMDDIVFVLDRENRYTSFYARPEDLFLSADKFIGKKIAEVMPANINELFEEVLPEVKAGKTMGFEYPLDMPDGKHWYSIKLSPMIENNEYSGLAAVSRDITESKQAGNSLKQTHERLTDTLESMSDGFVSLDKNWIYTYVNKRAAEMFGRKPEDLIGKHIWTEFPDAIDQPFYKTYYKVAETRKQISFEDYYQPWDRWFENQVIPTKDGLAIFFQDITDRKQVSESIHASESRLKEAQRIAQVGSWELDLITNKLHWSDEVYRIFDLEPQQFGATYEAFLEHIHPDDREMVDQVYSESVKNKTPYEIVHRLLLKDGTIKFVNEHSKTFYDDSGKAIRSFGTVQDISELKRVSVELESKTDLIETLVQTIPDLIWLKDTEGVYLKCNPGIERLYGTKEADILGKTDYDFIDKELADFFRENDRKAQEANKPTTNEEFLSFADGSYKGWFETTKAPMFDKKGAIVGVLGIARDISQRKKYDEEISQLNTHLEQKVEERTLDLEKKNKTLEKLNKVFIGRELRMVELKKEIEKMKNG